MIAAIAFGSEVQCIMKEKQALLKFKQGLEDDGGLLSSWESNEDCCRSWKGVQCSNKTGHVVKLDLRPHKFLYDFPWSCNVAETSLSGEVSPALVKLHYLEYLDLSYHRFNNTNFLKLISSFTNLRYLNLSNTGLNGTIPKQLGNLSSLISIDLSNNFCLETDDLDRLSHLSSYKFVNRLFYHDLSCKDLRGSFPSCYASGEETSLVHLDTSFNHLQGMIPKNLENLQSLQVLDLSRNNLSGEVLIDFTKLLSLKELRLSNNGLNGSLPESIGKLFKLELLDVSSNSLDGIVTEVHLLNLSLLRHLDLSFNSLSLNFTSSSSSVCRPTFQLDTLKLSSCKMLEGTFPQWLQTQKKLSHLDVSNASISESIPNWFWNISYNLRYLNLSSNQINGIVPDLSSRFTSFPTIDLSNNKFSGPLSAFPLNTTVLNLSNNSFQGTISFLCTMTTGTLTYLDLSSNFLSGSLPDCWTPLHNLVLVNVANNNLSGTLPNSIQSLRYIRTLHLDNNNFVGELPDSLRECRYLEVLDLGENKFSGKIPSWIEEMTHLRVLRLSSNSFSGSIPPQLCRLASLQVLDVSHNKISGSIPRCLNNITAMVQEHRTDATIRHFYVYFYEYYNSSDGSYCGYCTDYIDNVRLVLKKKGLVYSNSLGLVKAIDLSSNKLRGGIPAELTNLSGLIALNLSGNLLTGNISRDIGKLKQLESLDLSRNQLSGEIPTSLSSLSFLGNLDLSNNNLSGKIPAGTQLQSFDASAYRGNPNLCGQPLPNKCPSDGNDDHNQAAKGPVTDGSYETEWLYASVVLGFILGFWGVSIKFDRCVDRLCVKICGIAPRFLSP